MRMRERLGAAPARSTPALPAADFIPTTDFVLTTVFVLTTDFILTTDFVLTTDFTALALAACSSLLLTWLQQKGISIGASLSTPPPPSTPPHVAAAQGYKYRCECKYMYKSNAPPLPISGGFSARATRSGLWVIATPLRWTTSDGWGTGGLYLFILPYTFYTTLYFLTVPSPCHLFSGRQGGGLVLPEERAYTKKVTLP